MKWKRKKERELMCIFYSCFHCAIVPKTDEKQNPEKKRILMCPCVTNVNVLHNLWFKSIVQRNFWTFFSLSPHLPHFNDWQMEMVTPASHYSNSFLWEMSSTFGYPYPRRKEKDGMQICNEPSVEWLCSVGAEPHTIFMSVFTKTNTTLRCMFSIISL